jgi:hypothetical protein
MAAQESDRRRPVKAASRRSRSRTARALTGLGRSGNSAQSGMVLCPLNCCAKASLLEVSSARNGRINVDFAWFLRNRTLRVKNAHCAKVLILPRVSHVRPGRNVRLLFCHRSVGGRLPAVPVRSFAKLRSERKPDQAPGSRFRAGSLQSTCRIFGDRTCVTCRQIERSQDAGAAAAVLVLCRSGAGRRQADGSRSDVVMSGVVDSGRGERTRQYRR